MGVGMIELRIVRRKIKIPIGGVLGKMLYVNEDIVEVWQQRERIDDNTVTEWQDVPIVDEEGE